MSTTLAAAAEGDHGGDEIPSTAVQQPVVPKRYTYGNETIEESKGRGRWPNRFGFYLAAIGSAVGFGNVWRFPALAKDYGGGAFFIPYLMALFIVGLPLLLLEIALGQYCQAGNVGLFGKFHPRLRGVGIASVVNGFILVGYYSMLLSWVANAFFDSFGTRDPWAKDGIDGSTAVGYFYDEIIGMETLGPNNRPTRLVGANIGYSALVWVCIWLCLAFGMKITGWIAYVTMGLPILFLIIFVIKSVTLTGASNGIEEYIGIWDMSILKTQPDVWSRAVSQIFFSLSLTFGTMTAYGSHCPRTEPAFLNSLVIGLSNSAFSFISGFAVFAAMGHLAYLEQTTVDNIPYSSFGLVFGTWPVVFGTFNGGEHWVRLLFLDLYLLGVDSAFSVLEGPLTVATDYLQKHGYAIPKWQVCAVFCFAAFVTSLLYATDAGLIFLDTVDFYINFTFLFMGFLQAFGAAWCYGIEKQIASLGVLPVLTHIMANFLSVFIACGVWFGVDNTDNAVWAGFITLFIWYGFFMAITLFLLSRKMHNDIEGKWTWSSILYELTFKNVMELHDELQKVVGYIPSIWAIGMKQIIPHILLIAFINLARSDNGNIENPKSQFGHYESYVTYPFQFVGILTVCVATVVVIIGIFFPNMYEGFDLTTLEVVEEEEEEVAVKQLDEEEDDENQKKVVVH